MRQERAGDDLDALAGHQLLGDTHGVARVGVVVAEMTSSLRPSTPPAR